MRIDIVTLFPELFEAHLRASLLGKAIEAGRLQVNLMNPRDFTHDRHRTVDDTPYGGGAGMVLKCEPLHAALEALRKDGAAARTILLSPRGRLLDQALVRELAAGPGLVLVCGRYEGVDERLSELVFTDEVSIGDYVLSGGELPAMVLVEAISRMLPGTVGDWESVETDSFYNGLLGPPVYTRPPEFMGRAVPDVLTSGNHAAIRRWRLKESLRATLGRRPELLEHRDLNQEEIELLAEIRRESTKEQGQ